MPSPIDGFVKSSKGSFFDVIPAQAGIQTAIKHGVPACVGDDMPVSPSRASPPTRIAISGGAIMLRFDGFLKSNRQQIKADPVFLQT
jgi:hypothetical protein